MLYIYKFVLVILPSQRRDTLNSSNSNRGEGCELIADAAAVAKEGDMMDGESRPSSSSSSRRSMGGKRKGSSNSLVLTRSSSFRSK